MSSRHSVAIISSWKVEASCRPASGACPPIAPTANRGGYSDEVSVSMVRIISGNLGELIGPGVDDWMAIDVVDAGHDAFLEFVF